MTPLDIDRADRLALEHLAVIGELAGPLTHEMTNFLNVLLLQVSLLEVMVPEDQRADLLEIRRQGNFAAALINSFQERRQGQPLERPHVEVSPLLDEVIEQIRKDQIGSSEVGVKRAQANLQIPGVPSDVRRLLFFLIANAVRAADRGGKKVLVSLLSEEDAFFIQVEDSGPTPTDKELLHLFDAGKKGREGVETLELAACRTLVRRLRGSLSAEALPQGGICVTVEFPRQCPPQWNG